jgi:very-short-patch-repair endonuclease
MAKAIDLTGQKFGQLEVIERDYEIQKMHPNERQAWWKCKCNACGNEKSLRSSVIKKAKTCGCNIGTHKGIIKIHKLDLTGQRFTRLLVLEEADEEHQVYYNNHHKVTWKCLCDCGNICYATTENLRRGDTPSCGCITKENRRKQLKDLSGQKFGHLTVLKWTGTVSGNSKYLVQCDCGKIYEVFANNLKQGTTQSCGCVKESHGENKIRELLIQNNINFETQKNFSDFCYEDTKGKPRYDFYLPDYNILIEYDGKQHFSPIFGWDTEERFELRKKHDIDKNNYAKNNHFILIRIPYTHYNNLCIKDLLNESEFILKEE